MVVHFHHIDAVESFINSLLLQNGRVKWSIVVVDNGSTAEEAAQLQMLVNLDARILLATAPRNLGYFGGVEYGRCVANSGGIVTPKWLLVANQDIVLEPSFLTNLVAGGADANAVLAPSVVSSPGGVEMNPFMVNRPTKVHTLIRMLAFCTISGIRLAVWAKGRKTSYETAGSLSPRTIAEGPVYAAHGSLIAFNRKFFEAGGTLKWTAFMFGEEIFVAEQARILGLDVFLRPDLRAVHYEHSSTGARSAKPILKHKRSGSIAASRLLLRGTP